MKTPSFLLLVAALVCVLHARTHAQVPVAIGIQFLKAEDARDYNPALEKLLQSPNAAVRVRAALAAGRIGDEAAVPALTSLIARHSDIDTQAMAAFALGEIESISGADAIRKLLASANTPEAVRARAVEAAGKIAAAHPTLPIAKELGFAIVQALNDSRGERLTVLMGLTAALRARPDKGDEAAAKYLTNMDARVRADAANTLARLRAKNANDRLREMVKTDPDPVARANAARALGAADDKAAYDVLLNAAIADRDPRVRVSAIGSLAQIRDVRAADKLLERGRLLLDAYKRESMPGFIPSVQSEFITVASAVGRLMANSYDQRAVELFREFGQLDKGRTPEVYLSRMRVAPGRGDDSKTELTHWRQYSTMAQIIGEFAVLEPTRDDAKKMKGEAPDILRPLVMAYAAADPKTEAATIMAAPDVLQAYSRFKPGDLASVLRLALQNKDVHVRATAAGLLDDLPVAHENTDAVRTAFLNSLVSDKQENDAQLAMLDALNKMDKNALASVLDEALVAPDYLVRKRALDLLKAKDAWKDVPDSVMQPL
ncbi:MAG: HEAT repeat domain-containing protein, partial [Pyrinomonadaceae bacterium]